MTAADERRALDQIVVNFRRIATGQRQSIRRPQQLLVAARREEKAPGETHPSSA